MILILRTEKSGAILQQKLRSTFLPSWVCDLPEYESNLPAFACRCDFVQGVHFIPPLPSVLVLLLSISRSKLPLLPVTW